MAEPVASRPSLNLERIYLRDLSFESPRAPEVFAAEWKPQLQLDINSGARALGDGRFEVILTLTIEATSGESALLVVELQQAGVFRVEGFDEETRRRVLAVACPNMLYPYARETVDTLVVKGTFPPFMLASVNFDALYVEAQKHREAESGQGVEA